jgi:AraC-like DNA-binding protein
MQRVGDMMKERNIELDTLDPVAKGGFTQIPNFILRAANLTPGAKMVYALFISYAWHNDCCFPGQERLAQDMGLSRSTVSTYVKELEGSGYLTLTRRGLGQTNLYTLHFKVGKSLTTKDVARITSRA